MPQMKMLQNRNVSTKLGHMLVFEANVARNVPPEAIGDAQAAGAVLVGNEGAVADEETAGHQIFAVSAELRRSVILRVIEALVQRNASADFDAGGQPKMAAIQQRCPLETSRDEIDELYTLYKTATVDKSKTIVWHPQTDDAMEALDATSRTDIVELGKKFKVSKEDQKSLSTLPMSDAKTRLVGLLAGYKGD